MIRVEAPYTQASKPNSVKIILVSLEGGQARNLAVSVMDFPITSFTL